MQIIEIQSENQLQQLLTAALRSTLWIFKHSTRCSISSAALAEFQAYARELPEDAEPTLGLVRVIENRPVSETIARITGIEHASPQAILMKDGTAVWNQSHWQITKAALIKAMAEHAS
jgi:bacillithiol system protein YtxJ